MLIKRLLILPLVVLVAWMVMAFFVVRQHSEAHRKEQLVIGSIGEPDTLNPIISQSISAAEVEDFIFDALVVRDEDLNIVGSLAREFWIAQNSSHDSR